MKYLLSAFFIFFLSNCASSIPEDEIITKTHTRTNFINEKILDTFGDNHENWENKDFIQNFFNIFDDPILQNLIQIALKNNTDILTFTSKIAQARSLAKISGADLLPKIGVNLGYNYSDGNYKKYQINFNQNTLNGSFTLAWEIDIFGKINALRHANKEQFFSAQKNLENAKISLITDLANYYFNIRKFVNTITIAQKLVKNQEKILEINEIKYNLGLVDISEVAPLKTQLFIQKKALFDLKYQLEQNKNALLVLLNTNDLGFDTHILYDFKEPKLPKIQKLPAQTLLDRPDIQSAIHALNTQIYTKASKRAEFFPSINLTGNIGQILFSNNGIGDLIWQITGALSMPLLNRSAIRENYKIQQENLKQAFYVLQNSINTALGEIENALIDMQNSDQNLLNSKQSNHWSKETLEAMKLKTNYKLIDELGFLNYENQYLNTKKDLYDSFLSNVQAAIVLYKSFGGIFMSINQNKDKNAN
ncbi:TolC family protein [Helicobacter sp. 11S03491-1]|uniref:TolC family protein n=1 Tax=Helicobacter sp. 11S03491-1 TaxID=1476196 RepID=UPI000BA5EF92|nr:TolC family protein [Helicobacter sp. 11S03491-1]PAF42232.1 hypothetical protein BKH45_04620 [Helicobacter sp. 11S03491-1]